MSASTLKQIDALADAITRYRDWQAFQVQLRELRRFPRRKKRGAEAA